MCDNSYYQNYINYQTTYDVINGQIEQNIYKPDEQINNTSVNLSQLCLDKTDQLSVEYQQQQQQQLNNFQQQELFDQMQDMDEMLPASNPYLRNNYTSQQTSQSFIDPDYYQINSIANTNMNHSFCLQNEINTQQQQQPQQQQEIYQTSQINENIYNNNINYANYTGNIDERDLSDEVELGARNYINENDQQQKNLKVNSNESLNQNNNLLNQVQVAYQSPFPEECQVIPGIHLYCEPNISCQPSLSSSSESCKLPNKKNIHKHLKTNIEKRRKILQIENYKSQNINSDCSEITPPAPKNLNNYKPKPKREYIKPEDFDINQFTLPKLSVEYNSHYQPFWANLGVPDSGKPISTTKGNWLDLSMDLSDFTTTRFDVKYIQAFIDFKSEQEKNEIKINVAKIQNRLNEKSNPKSQNDKNTPLTCFSILNRNN